MKATEKHPDIAKGINAMLGKENAREDAVASLCCVPKPIGCGKAFTAAEVQKWSAITVREYRISGLCRDCQILIFGE